MRQHGVAVAAITGNCFGDRLELGNAAIGKSLHTGRLCDQLINRHVQGGKESRIELLGQQVLFQTLGHVPLTDLLVLLWVGQNLVNYVVQGFQFFGRNFSALKFLRKLGHRLRIYLRRPCQHFVRKLLWRNGLTHLVIDCHVLWGQGCGRCAHLFIYHGFSLRCGQQVCIVEIVSCLTLGAP